MCVINVSPGVETGGSLMPVGVGVALVGVEVTSQLAVGKLTFELSSKLAHTSSPFCKEQELDHVQLNIICSYAHME